MQETLIVFALILLTSLIFKKLYGNSDNVKEGINAVVFNVMLPALCVKTFAVAKIDYALLFVPAIAWLVILFCTAIGFITARIVSRFFLLFDNEIGVLVLVSAFGNVLYLGAPVLATLYGQEAVKYALVFDFLASTPLVWTLAAFIASYYGDKGGFSLRSSLKTIIGLPPLWGIAIGAGINVAGFQIDGLLLKFFDMLGCAVTPLMIFSIGLSLKIPPIKYAFVLIPFVFIKLFIAPLMAFYITGIFPLDEIARKSAITESAMPVMVLLLIVSARYKLNESLTALAITLSTALSFISLPFVAYMLDRYI